MNTIQIKNHKNNITLYFGTDKKGVINAYVLATSLVNFADAIKEANAIVNPGYEIEVVVTATGSGSFKVTIGTINNKLGNIFSSKPFQSILYGILASIIYQHTFAPNPVNIQIQDNQVIIEEGNNKIIIPRETYEAAEKVKKSNKFKNTISKCFSDLNKNEEITSFGILEHIDDTEPNVIIHRDDFSLLINEVAPIEKVRAVYEEAELLIKTAVLKKSRKKWEFIWRGFEIKSAIHDDIFYQKFYSHKITIAPGDTLNVKLKINQELDSAGIYVNKSYEIESVYSHTPKLIQSEL